MLELHNLVENARNIHVNHIPKIDHFVTKKNEGFNTLQGPYLRVMNTKY